MLLLLCARSAEGIGLAQKLSKSETSHILWYGPQGGTTSLSLEQGAGGRCRRSRGWRRSCYYRAAWVGCSFQKGGWESIMACRGGSQGENQGAGRPSWSYSGAESGWRHDADGRWEKWACRNESVRQQNKVRGYLRKVKKRSLSRK